MGLQLECNGIEYNSGRALIQCLNAISEKVPELKFLIVAQNFSESDDGFEYNNVWTPGRSAELLACLLNHPHEVVEVVGSLSTGWPSIFQLFRLLVESSNSGEEVRFL